MEIVQALKHEEAKLHRQLKAVQAAIAALNGGAKTVASVVHTSSPNGASGTRTLSAAGRARISRAMKARWARVRAAKARKAK